MTRTLTFGVVTLLCAAATAWAGEGVDAVDAGVSAAEPAAAPEASPSPPPKPSPELRVAAAPVNAPLPYVRYCSWCHGILADGNGVSAHRFDIAATDFTRGAYKCRSTPTGAPPTADDLRSTLRDGLFASGMPSFQALSSGETEEIVSFLKDLLPPTIAAAAAPPLAVPPEPANDGASLQRGAAAYVRLKCDTCHGRDGRGGPNQNKSVNDNGTLAHATMLTEPFRFKCGASPSRLYLTVMTGLDGTPMAGYAEVAAPEEAWDVVHFVQSLAQLR